VHNPFANSQVRNFAATSMFIVMAKVVEPAHRVASRPRMPRRVAPPLLYEVDKGAQAYRHMAVARVVEANPRVGRGPIRQKLNQTPVVQVVGDIPLGYVREPIPTEGRLADQARVVEGEPAGNVHDMLLAALLEFPSVDRATG
jgi:hypothetical protein